MLPNGRRPWTKNTSPPISPAKPSARPPSATRRRTKVGTRVNLEQPLTAGKEFGGHFVLGHVDGIGRVTRLATEGENWWYGVEGPRRIRPLHRLQRLHHHRRHQPHRRALERFSKLHRPDRRDPLHLRTHQHPRPQSRRRRQPRRRRPRQIHRTPPNRASRRRRRARVNPHTRKPHRPRLLRFSQLKRSGTTRPSERSTPTPFLSRALPARPEDRARISSTKINQSGELRSQRTCRIGQNRVPQPLY